LNVACILVRKKWGHPLASHRGDSGSGPGLVKWDLWWTKWRWWKFSPRTSVSSANLHSTKFSILIITRGRYNRPEVAEVPSGLSMDSTPHYAYLVSPPLPYTGSARKTPRSFVSFYCRISNHSKVKVTLRLTVSQPVCLVVESRLGIMTRYLLTV
jgi:hypothetical protein